MLPNDPGTNQRLPDGQAHQDAGDEVLHIRPAGDPGHGAASDAEDDENEALGDDLLALQLLCAALQVENLLIVVDPHTALRRVLADHELRKRHMELAAEPLNDAVVRHALTVLPLGDRLV